jgi:hypothetical protein
LSLDLQYTGRLSETRKIIRRGGYLSHSQPFQFLYYFVTFINCRKKGLDGTTDGAVTQTLELLPDLRWQRLIPLNQMIDPFQQRAGIELTPLVDITLKCPCPCSKFIHVTVDSHVYLLQQIVDNSNGPW